MTGPLDAVPRSLPVSRLWPCTVAYNLCHSTLAIGRHFRRPEHFGAEISAHLSPCGLWDYKIRAGSSAPIAIRQLESCGSAFHHDLRGFSGRPGPGLRWAGATPQEMAAVSGTVSHAEGRNGQSRVLGTGP